MKEDAGGEPAADGDKAAEDVEMDDAEKAAKEAAAKAAADELLKKRREIEEQIKKAAEERAEKERLEVEEAEKGIGGIRGRFLQDLSLFPTFAEYSESIKNYNNEVAEKSFIKIYDAFYTFNHFGFPNLWLDDKIIMSEDGQGNWTPLSPYVVDTELFCIVNFGQHTKNDEGMVQLFGVGRKIKLDDAEKTITIYEGQFVDNELDGVGRRIVINYSEATDKLEQTCGQWSKGKENGLMNIFNKSIDIKPKNKLYKDGVVDETEVKPEDEKKLKFDSKKYLGLV